MLSQSNRSSLATAPSTTPFPCRVPLNGMFHEDSATQLKKLLNPYLWNCWMALYHLKFYGIVWTCSCATSWSFDLVPGFSRSNFENSVFQDWHGTKQMWVDRMLPHPWPWPLIFKVKFWKCSNSGMGCPIDMERKRCESPECCTHVVTFNFDLAHDLDFEFSMSNFEIAVSHECEGWLIWNERDMSR